MIRRLALASCAVLAAATLASCSTFDRNGDAARVGSVTLSQDDLDVLLGYDGSGPTDASTADTSTADTTPDTVDGDTVRQQLTGWIRTVLIEQALGKPLDAVEIASSAALQDRLTQDLRELALQTGDAGRGAYEAGLPASNVACLAAIPVADEAGADEVVQALAGGMSFEDAAARYSTDPTLAGNGGVVSQGGAECLDLREQSLNPQLIDALSGKGVGAAVPLTLDTLTAVVQLRPYDSLSEEDRAVIALASIPDATISDVVSDGEVYVDPRYGWWDPESVSVLPLGSDALTQLVGG